MTPVDATGAVMGRPGQDHHAVAIASVLASIARGRPEAVATAVCEGLATAAANAGGVEALLGESGYSAANDHLRLAIEAVGGEPLDLTRWRTAPIRIVFDAGQEFCDMGIDVLYEETYQDLLSLEGTAFDLALDACATPAEQTRAREILRDASNVWSMDDPAEVERALALAEEGKHLIESIELRNADHPLVKNLRAARADITRLEQLRDGDETTYRAAFQESARRFVRTEGFGVDVELVPLGDYTPGDEIADRAEDYARQHTPLPMSKQLPDHSDGTPAEALRREGLTYLERLQEDTDGPHSR